MQRVLDLDISILAKFLFLYASSNTIGDIVSRLSPEQKKQLLKDLLKIDLSENTGRVWAHNSIRKAC
jgi:hypothetical protein